MTRENLIEAIDKNNDPWSCPEAECNYSCRECAEMQLEDYENKIKAAVIDELAGCVLEWLWEVDIPSATCPEYIEHHRDIQNIAHKVQDKVKQMKGEKG